MADFTTTYREVETNGEQASGRRSNLANVDGPASFLALAVGMGVPIISRVQPGASGSLSIGGGLSFAVARTSAAITLEKGLDWANETPKDWFARVQSGGDQPDKFVLKNQVNKRILPARGSDGMSKYDQDANTFFAVSTEVRILAREAIRKSSNIVSLIALSWNTRETSGRSLPEILLEGAQHGSLRQYLQVQSTRLGFRSKALMVMDLAAGLAFLHENGIVHRDVKPDNLLVCDSPQRKSLQPWGMAPVILKLCDFGCSVIISDYNQDHMFSQPVGTPGWMAPEVEQGLPVSSELLFKTDLYSLGLVAAQIFRNTRLSPSPSPAFRATVTDGSLAKASKRKHDEIDEGDESLDRPRILAEQPGPSMQGATKSEQVAPGTSGNASLEGGKSNLLRDVLSCTLPANPSDRRDARAVYNLCQDGLLHNCTPRDTEVIRSALPGFPIGEAKVLSAKSQFITPRVPNLAFETSLRPGLLPRQCHMEIVKDFQRRVNDGTNDAGSCALQLAAVILNGYLMCEYDQIGSEVEKHLTMAVRLGDPLALLGTINILQALGRVISPEIRRRVLEAFEDPDFQLQTVTDMKGLFLPLSFDPTTRMTSAAQFPLDEKSTIQTKLIGLRTWKREFPESFAAFLDSETYRQLTAVFPLTRLVPQTIDWPDPISLELGNSMVREYVYTSSICLDIMCTEKRDAFVNELLENDMVNSPAELGMTLLQLTVLRNDLSMASLLLETLSADTEAYGLTPRCSPLWLACYLGHADMATLLIDHGADLTCSDSLQELTILHLLTQFSTEDAVLGIGYSALAAGVDINARSDSQITPLLAALLTFDFSDGVAVEFLLDNGADPLKYMVTHLEGFIFPACPLTLCTFHLDTDMLQQMLAVIPPGTQETLTNRGGSESTVRQELGFQLMRSQTAFAAMFETGWRYRDNLRLTLKRVIDAERSHLLWMNPPVEPAVYAFEIGRPDLMDVLLDLDHSVVMEKLAPDGSGRRVILLHEAVLQHNVRSVDILIRHGTSLLQPTTRFGDTILTWLVKELPDMLPMALKHLEGLPAAQRGGKTVKQILQVPQLAAAGVFDYLLLHGTSQDIALAELLRVQYSLNHDSIQPLPPDTTTLMGALLQSASWDGFEKMAQLRYLVSLRPLPRFVMPKGVNLLYVALAMFNITAAAERLDLLRLLLNAYPDIKNLTQGHRHILPVTHHAASYGYLEIIQLMEEHVKLRHPGNKFPYNYMHLHNIIPQCHSLLTMLDCSRYGITMPEFASTSWRPKFGDKDTDLLDMSKFDHMAIMGRREQVYRYLRDQGAVHGWELDGYLISARVLWKSTVHPDELHGFLDRATSKYFLDPWDHGPGPGEFPSTWHPFAWREVEKSTDSKAINQLLGLMGMGAGSEAYAVKSELTICELVWRGNGFFLQAWDLPFASSCLAEDVAHYFSKRVEERIRWETNFDGLGGNPPYLASSYREKEEQAVLYTRSSRTWTDEEVCKLSHDVFDEWAVNFGELEDLIPDDLKAAVEPFSKPCLHP